MSDYDREKGTLTPVTLTEGQTIKAKIRELCLQYAPKEEVDTQLSDSCYRDNPIEYLSELCWEHNSKKKKKHIDYYLDTISDTLYKVDYTEYKDIDFYHFQENEDGIIDFHLLYWNGGVCRSELTDRFFKDKHK